MKLFISIVVLGLCIQFSYSQVTQNTTPGAFTCATDHMNDRLHKQHRQTMDFHQLLERTWYRRLSRGNPNHARSLYVIPVVVHLVHNNGPANLTDVQVRQTIAAMNDGMRNRGVFDPNTGVDVEIEFCLAQQDPAGNPSTGITRTLSPLGSVVLETQDLAMKNLSRWDPTRYLNIWVVDNIFSLSSGPGVAGYAYFPSSHGNPEDGIVGEAYYFNSLPDRVSVFIHEAGHYLGLYHTFEGGCTNNDCLADGDRVCDTPPDASTNAVACNSTTTNSCVSDADDPNSRNPFRATSLGGLGDQHDMVINYMDYNNPSCYSAFTQGQKDRMVLAITGPRVSLLASNACQNPCTNPIRGSFTLSGLPATVGSSIQLNAVVSLGTAISYDWKMNGGSFSSLASPSYTFSRAGRHIFTLRVSGNDPACFFEYHDTLEVTCEPRADFSGYQPYILPGDQIMLTATGPTTGNYSWLVNQLQVATGAQFLFSSNTAGSFFIQLVRDNGICKDTSEGKIVRVESCSQDLNAHKMWWALDHHLMMDFRTAPPAITRNSTLEGGLSAGRQHVEHSVTMSDQFGSLMFYANGHTIWDRGHNQMPGGQGLQGHASTSQGSISFADPADPDIYYLFTLDAYTNSYQNGLRYSKVNMRLRNGLGDVVASEKNQFVSMTNNEQMDAVEHANGIDIWVVVPTNPVILDPANSELKAFLVTANGVSTNPVITPTPGLAKISGDIKFSDDGQWLYELRNGRLYRFDKQTGQASLFMTIHETTTAEFSPDNSKLYLGRYGTNVEMVQYDLNASTPAGILASATALFSRSLSQRIFLPQKAERGPDEKIYIRDSESNTLHIIHEPNLAGTACDFRFEDIRLPLQRINKPNAWNLPTYIRARPTNHTLAASVDHDRFCFGDSAKIWLDARWGRPSVSYRVLGQAPGYVKNDTFIIHPANAGLIEVELTVQNACGSILDTVELTTLPGPVLDLGDDQKLCQGSIIVQAGAFPDAAYLWSDGSRNSQITIQQPGEYWLRIEDTLSGCTVSDTIDILSATANLNPDLGPDTSICNGAILPLKLNNNYAEIRWQDGSTDPGFTVFRAGTYWVDVLDDCGEKGSDTIVVSFTKPDDIGLPEKIFFCPGGSVAVDISSSYPVLNWLDGHVGGQRIFDEEGVYIIHGSDPEGCVAYDTVEVIEYPEPPEIPLPPVVKACEGEAAVVDASLPALLTYRWDDGIEGPVRTISKPGIYSVQALDQNGCQTSADVEVVLSPEPEIQLPDEVRFCRPDSFQITLDSNGQLRYEWNDGYRGAARTLKNTGVFTVKVTNEEGCSTSAILRVVAENCPEDVHMPSGFTPNGDGHNELVGPIHGGAVSGLVFRIYNRWGQLIYQGEGPDALWDGRYKGQPCPEGVYVYTLAFRTATGRVARKKGTVTLLR